MSSLKPLPEGNGPKLEPFGHDLLADDVEFLKILENVGIHGVVVKTRIRGRVYAIKFFTDTDQSTPEYFAEEYPLVVSVDEADEFESHFIPFDQECRAFGRLKEVDREHLAVKVYGYVSVKVDEAFEAKMHYALSKSPTGPKKAAAVFLTGSFEIKGIVKDWVEPATYEGYTALVPYAIDSLISYPHFRRMLEGLHEIHRCGIVVRDMSISQYVNGVLVDFSMAWTMPHPFGPGRGMEPSWTFQSLAAWDLVCFQTKVIDWWNELRHHLPAKQRKCPLQAHPDSEGLARQGPFLPIINHEDLVLDMVQLPRYDPGAFNAEEADKMIREKKKRSRVSGGRAAQVQKKRRVM
ncbi:hypothetical protein ACHAPT_004766 [Fusarium lateritium]